DRIAFALAYRAQDEKIADRLWHVDAGGDRHRVVPSCGVLDALLERAHHRRAAGRLHRHHAGPFAPDKTDRLQLSDGLPHADPYSTAAGRIQDHVRHLPAELLGKLEPHRLLALDAIGLLERRGVEPADHAHALSDDLAAIVDAAVHAIDRCALRGDL